MRHARIIVLALAVICILVTATTILASTPRKISYQGRATDAGGNSVPDGTYPARFYLYDHPTAGSVRWSETTASVTASGGLFTYLLGSISPISDDLFTTYDSLYLEIVFNGQTLSPRTPIVSVGYAFRVNSIDGAYGGTITGPMGVRIGDDGTTGPTTLLILERAYNTSATLLGQYLHVTNAGNGAIYGFESLAEATTAGAGGPVYAGFFVGTSDNTARVGVYGKGTTQNAAITTGTSYGVFGSAAEGLNAYGIYGSTTGTATNEYGGYFSGNIHCTGTLSKGAGAFKIDHPLDPENKYLQHSFVESPDMMNIYNGNVTLDANGEALVQFPNWFTALNKDFRYQLTAIGAPGPNLYIAEEVSNNQFRIAGGQPLSKVSWQVTGIRHDKYADANRIQVEVDKQPQERGTYMHPEAYGLGEERFVNYEQEKAAREAAERRPEQTAMDNQR